MTAQQLKNSILQLAVQGKLVPQDPNDEPASVLLERITKERERLIKEKKIKKPKTTSRIFRRDGHYYESVNGGEPTCIDEQIPFDIPDSWEWVKLSTIAYGVGSKENQVLSKNIKEKGLFPVVSQGAALFDGYADDRDRVIDNIPLVLFGDHTRNVKYIDFPFIIGADGTKFLKPIHLSPKFLYYVLLLVADGLRDRGYARHFSLLQKECLPLPPIAEQERIITKIESILPTVQSYGNASTELIKLDSSLTGVLKKSILQHAIQGKLVPQDLNDEPASVLLERIAKERAKMGKKAAKSMSRIERRDRGTYEIFPDGSEKDISEEIPFDIPESWEWCRSNQVSYLSGGFAFKSSNFTQSGVRVIRISDFTELGINKNAIVRHVYREDLSDYEINLKDILLCMTGGTVGKCCIINTIEEMMYLNQRVCSIRSFIEPDFTYSIISSFYIQGIITKAKNSTNDNISMELIKNFLLPIPPLQEQHRIIEKLGALMNELGATK